MMEVSIPRMEYEARLSQRLGRSTIEVPGDYWVPMARTEFKKRLRRLGLLLAQSSSFTRPAQLTERLAERSG